MSSTSTPPPPPPAPTTTTKDTTPAHPDLHTQWEAQQDHLRASIITQDTFPIESLTLIGGVDLSFFDAPSPSTIHTYTHTHTHISPSSHHALACLVILTYPQLEVVYESFLSVCVSVPYISGFLAFREAPPLMELMEKLKRERPELVPQVVLVDGNGILHPRGCGLASHLGVCAGVPTIGCTKTFLHVDGLETREVREAITKQRQENAKIKEDTHSSDEKHKDTHTNYNTNTTPPCLYPLLGQSGQTWGMALLPPSAMNNPIYISIGTGLSLETAVQIVYVCCKQTRIPEPIRQADIRSRGRIREILKIGEGGEEVEEREGKGK